MSKTHILPIDIKIYQFYIKNINIKYGYYK